MQNHCSMEDFETLGDYLEKHNPLALKNGKNEILYFKNYEAAYLYALKEMRKYCKKGYVELPLLVKHFTGFDDESCEDVASYMKQAFQEWQTMPVLIDWQRVGYEKEKLMAIMRGMHEITETEFDWVEFECAWNEFRTWNEKFEDGKETDKEELRDKTQDSILLQHG